MGLDIYVGPLCRYYTGAWLTILQKEAPAMGLEVEMVHSEPDSDDAITDPAQALPVIEEWRGNLQEALREHDAEIGWEEFPEGEYFTDKPAWNGYAALLLWACYQEHPELRPPATCPDAWHEDPAFEASTNEDFETQYPHLLNDTELWLPGDFPFTFEAEDPAGSEMTFGSTSRLLAELEALNAATWALDGVGIDRWRREGADREASLEHAARFGLAVLLPLARTAVSQRLPLKLDY